MPITIKLYIHTHTHKTTYNKLIGISKYCCCHCLIAKSCPTLGYSCWEIPQKEEPGELQSMGPQKSQTQHSN